MVPLNVRGGQECLYLNLGLAAGDAFLFVRQSERKIECVSARVRNHGVKRSEPNLMGCVCKSPIMRRAWARREEKDEVIDYKCEEKANLC